MEQSTVATRMKLPRPKLTASTNPQRTHLAIETLRAALRTYARKHSHAKRCYVSTPASEMPFTTFKRTCAEMLQPLLYADEMLSFRVWGTTWKCKIIKPAQLPFPERVRKRVVKRLAKAIEYAQLP